MRLIASLLTLAVLGLISRCGGGAPSDVAGYARSLQSRIGTKVGAGRVTAVKAEGDILVVTIDGPANWRLRHQSFMLTAPFLDGFCDSGRAKSYFQEGRKIRLDTTEAGRGHVRGEPSSRCPHD